MPKIDLASQKTVLVLGAGASNPYDFPLGPQLKISAAAHVSNPDPQKNMEKLGFDPELVKSFVENLNYSNIDTIDRFLELKPKYRDIGAYAIASVIFPIENEQKLFRPGNTHAWYWDLFQAIGFGKKDSVVDNLSIVTLNYDRSLEHFLNKAIDHNLPDNKIELAHEQRKGLKIVHAHGALGPYPEVPFANSKNINQDQLHELSKNIRIVSDDMESSSVFQSGKNLIDAAYNVVFLGFGYNMRTFSALIDRKNMGRQKFFGTAMDLPKEKKLEVERYLLGDISEDDEDGDCFFNFGGDNEHIRQFLQVLSVTK